MSFNLDTKRRDDKRIKSVAIGQKPTCIIKIFPWENPAKLSLLPLGLTNGDLFESNKAAGDKTGGGREPYVIDNDLVRCTINKEKNSSSGGFSFILKRGNKGDKGQRISDKQIDYLSSLSPGDWVTIYMKSDGLIDTDLRTSDSGLKLLGIIENVRYIEIDDPSLGKPRLEYVITGRDFGKIFESSIYFNPVVTGDAKAPTVVASILNDNAEKQFGKSSDRSPDLIIKNMIDYYMKGGLASNSSTSQKFYLPNGIGKLFHNTTLKNGNSVPFVDILNTKNIGLQNYSKDETLLAPSKLLGGILMLTAPASGTIWSALQSFANMSMNEFVVDLKKTKKLGLTADGKQDYLLEPTITLRQVPYSNYYNSELSPYAGRKTTELANSVTDSEKTHFVNLPKHILHSTDIKQKNVGKSDFERVNAITVVPSFFSSEAFTQAYKMVINVPSIERYGTKILNVNTAYAATGEDFNKHATKCLSLLSDWFITAHLLYNGTIISTGTDEFVEVGQNLFIEDIKQLYHIEGISYIYEINQADGNTTYNTEFRVSRGQRFENGVAKFIDSNTDLSIEGAYSTVVSNTLENIRNNENTKL